VTRTLQKAKALATHPRMAAKYAAWLGAKLTGRECTAGLPGGGTVGGFRRFTDYWAVNVPSSPEYQLLRRVVLPGSVVADVGANLGAFAITMSRLCPTARVFAFEPSPTTIGLLRANVERNGARNVEVIQAAVADRPGDVRLTDDPICAARNHIVADPTDAAASVSVAAITLDRYFGDRGVDQLAFVKTDTEGAETRVLRGAAGLLRDRRISCLLIEVCGAHLKEMGSSVAELLAAIEGPGYAAHRLLPDGTAGRRLTAADLEGVDFENVLVQ
jgi:FkbM family methyltransferase